MKRTPRSAEERKRRSSRSLVAVMALASVTVMAVDAQGGDSSPFAVARDVLGEAFAPAQESAATVARPLREVPEFFTSNRSLRSDVQRLEAENARLRGQINTTSQVRYRAAELDGLLRSSRQHDLALVPARVVAMGPAQSFSHTVTIDAGTSSGIRADMTVLNNDGLVGRVVEARRGSSTVLLIVDQRSMVGARLGSNAEVGFLKGRGSLDGRSRLDLDLVDNSQTPGKDDVVVTWGSRGGGPYVPGVPIGSVSKVFSSPLEQAKHAVIEPYVDFSSLDVVGVVVTDDTEGDRAVIRAGRADGAGSADMPVVRGLLLTVVLLAAVVLQVSFFGYFSFGGVVPNLVLLLVVAAALSRGPEFAVVLGFAGGLVADLLPPAQHVAGRWALALVVVGYLAGRVRADAARSTVGMLVTVAASSFIGTSVFALTGVLTRDQGVPALEALQVVPQVVLYDLLLAPFVLPLAMRMFRRMQPEQVAVA